MAEKTNVTCLHNKLCPAIFTLIAIQPLLDVLSYWTVTLGISGIFTLALRFCVLAFTVALGIILSDKKSRHITLCAILGIFTLCHVAVCTLYGYDNPISDLTNMIRIYQLPLMTLSFITFIRKDRRAIKTIIAGFGTSFGAITLIALIATLSGTDPHTYANKGIGIMGWFLTPNVQSAILSMAVPVFLAFVLSQKGKRLWWCIPACVVALGSLFAFATRLAYASLIATAVGLAIAILIERRPSTPKKWTSLLLLSLVILAVALIPLSPMTENHKRVAENALLKQQDIDALVKADTENAKAQQMDEDAIKLASLKSAYEKYLPGITGRFGLKTAAETYGYSTLASVLADTRLQRINYCRLLLKEQPLAILFGLELSDLSHGGGVYDAENDFHGIFFLCGIAGLLLIVLFFGYFLIKLAKALILDFKNTFSLNLSAFFISFCCALAHAFFTAGVLRRPNSNFYLAIICAVLYCLTNSDIRSFIDEDNR